MAAAPRILRSITVLALVLLLAAALPKLSEAGQANAVSGTVVARASGQPIPNATVAVEGSPEKTTTNGLGRFELNVSGATTLLVTAAGYLELRIPGVQPQAPLTIELERTPNILETVQVTATKSALRVGDVAAPTIIVDRETMERRGDQRLTEAIEHTPGAVITTELGIFESVLFRGMPRVGNEFTNTLLLIDGVPQTNSGN